MLPVWRMFTCIIWGKMMVNELRRILSDRRRCLVLLAVPLLCLGLFLYGQGGGGFDIRQSGAGEYQALLREYAEKDPEELAEALKAEVEANEAAGAETDAEMARLYAQAVHVRDYAAYLKQVQAQAEKQQNSSIFGRDKNSFVYRNILKTAEDFEPLIGTEVRLGNDRAVEEWLAFEAADYCFLVVMMIAAMSFFDERKKGLEAAIRCCSGGRGKLGIRRCGILLIFSVLYALLLYGLPLALSFAMNGTGDLSRPIQSLVSFKKCTAQLSVCSWIVRTMLVRIACGFLLGLLLWFFLSFLKQMQLMWLLTAAAFGLEYVLYRTISVQSVFSPLKHINVFSLVHASRLYTEYVNINFFGFPVGKRTLLLGLMLLLTVVIGAADMLLQSRRYPFGNRDILGKAVHLADRAGDALRRHWPRFLFEAHKWLVLSGSLLIIAAAAFLTRRLSFDSGAYYSVQGALERQYLLQMQGPVGEETDAYITRAREALERFGGDKTDFENAINRAEQRIDSLERRGNTEGFEPWVLEDTVLRNYMDAGARQTVRKNALIVTSILVFSLAPLFALERSGGMRQLLMSTAGGRNGTFRRKYALALLLTVFTFVLIYGREAYWLLRSYETVPLRQISCHNVNLFLHLPTGLSLAGALALYYAAKLPGMLAVMHICLYLSEIAGSGEKAMAVGMAVLLLPAAAYCMGADGAAAFTPMSFFSDGNPLFVAVSGRILCLVWFAFSLFLLLRIRRRWSGS